MTARDSAWPFDDLPNVAVFTLSSIVRSGAPILHVTHDEDDGGWQFLDGGAVTLDDAMLVALSTVMKLDQSVKELHDLPLGWCATRTARGQAWSREPSAEVP